MTYYTTHHFVRDEKLKNNHNYVKRRFLYWTHIHT